MPDRNDIDVEPAPAVLWPNLIPAPICTMLADLYRADQPQQVHRPGAYGPPYVRLNLTAWAPIIEELIGTVAQFGLPVRWVDPALIGYTPAVRRVTSGQRLCLIGFGHANVPDDESADS